MRYVTAVHEIVSEVRGTSVDLGVVLNELGHGGSRGLLITRSKMDHYFSHPFPSLAFDLVTRRDLAQ